MIRTRMGHREHTSSHSHLEEWASLLGADIAEESRAECDVFDERSERA
ncbi:hypothetical protein [Haloarcula marina]|nr:hypothetical protein [Halomicroarcula marina]